jgi:phage-related minor tail protein
MGNEVERLTVAVGADTAALSGAMGPIGGLSARLTSMFSNVGTMIAAGIGAAAVFIGKFAVDAAKDIGAGTRAIRQGTGATGEALKDLTGSMKNVGKDVPQNFATVGSAIADMNTRLGLTGKPLEDLTEQMLNLSRVTGEDVNALIQQTTRAFGDWSIATKDQGGALDYLYKVSQSTGIGVGTLSEKITKAGVPLRQLGFDFESSAAMVGKWEKEGVNLDMLLASLNRSSVNLAKGGVPDMGAAWDEMVGSIKGAKTETEAIVIASEYFGAKAASNMAGAIREGRLEIDDLKKSLAGSKETINKAADETLTFGDRMKILGNNAKVILQPLGKGLFIALNWAVKGLISAVKWVSQFINKLQTGGGAFKRTREIIVSVFNGIRNTISTAVRIIMAIWNRFGKQIWNVIVTAFKLIWNTVKSAFQVIKGIFQVFKAIFTGDWKMLWQGIKNIFLGVWNAIKGIFKAAWNAIKNLLAIAWNAITGLAKVIWEGIKLYFRTMLNAVRNAFRGVWNSIKSIITGIWRVIVSVAKGIWNGLKSYFTLWLRVVKEAMKLAWNTVKLILRNAWNAIVSIFNTIWQPFKALVTGIWDALSGIWNTVWGGIKGVVTGVWDALVLAWHTVIDPLVSVVKTIWDGIAEVWSGVWDGIVGVVREAVNGLIKGINLAIRGMNILNPLKDIPYIPEWKHVGGLIRGLGNVNIVAEGGEYMQRKAAVQKYGLDFMNAINSGTYQPGGSLSIGDIHLHSVSPDYDSDRLVELTVNKLFRRGRLSGGMAPRRIR